MPLSALATRPQPPLARAPSPGAGRCLAPLDRPPPPICLRTTTLAAPTHRADPRLSAGTLALRVAPLRYPLLALSAQSQAAGRVRDSHHPLPETASGLNAAPGTTPPVGAGLVWI